LFSKVEYLFNNSWYSEILFKLYSTVFDSPLLLAGYTTAGAGSSTTVVASAAEFSTAGTSSTVEVTSSTTGYSTMTLSSDFSTLRSINFSSYAFTSSKAN